MVDLTAFIRRTARTSMDRRSFIAGAGVLLSSKALVALAPMQTKNGDAAADRKSRPQHSH